MTKVCPTCKDSSIKSLIEEFEVFYCNNCHGLFSSKENNKIYPSIVTNTNKINFIEKFKIIIKQQFSKLRANNYLNYLQEKTDLIFKNSLDIGTGFGSFVKVLDEIGIDAYGIESDEKIKQFAISSKIKITNFQKDIDLPTYDLISVNQALYYFETPFEILSKITSLLNKNGMIFIVTVNTESKLVKKLKIWGDGMKICLSKKNFEMFAESSNLEIIDCSTYRDNFYIDFALYQQRKINSLSYWIKTLCYFLKIRKTHEKDPDGNNLFLLLKLKSV